MNGWRWIVFFRRRRRRVNTDGKNSPEKWKEEWMNRGRVPRNHLCGRICIPYHVNGVNGHLSEFRFLSEFTVLRDFFRDKNVSIFLLSSNFLSDLFFRQSIQSRVRYSSLYSRDFIIRTFFFRDLDSNSFSTKIIWRKAKFPTQECFRAKSRCTWASVMVWKAVALACAQSRVYRVDTKRATCEVA